MPLRNKVERDYIEIMDDIAINGDRREGRNGGTRSLFGRFLDINLRAGFPLLTTKRVHFKSIAAELLWFIRGETNVRSLQSQGVTIWDEWADENGDLGPVYGSQWRSWDDGKGGRLDQLKNVIAALQNEPYGRRHLVTAWNPALVDMMALPPCHYAFQFYVAQGRLSCMVHMRSADWFLGVPFNIASYALLTHLVARETHLEVDRLCMTFGDTHLYENHRHAVDVQMSRVDDIRSLPVLFIDDEAPSMFDMRLSDVSIGAYKPHDSIAAPVSK